MGKKRLWLRRAVIDAVIIATILSAVAVGYWYGTSARKVIVGVPNIFLDDRLAEYVSKVEEGPAKNTLIVIPVNKNYPALERDILEDRCTVYVTNTYDEPVTIYNVLFADINDDDLPSLLMAIGNLSNETMYSFEDPWDSDELKWAFINNKLNATVPPGGTVKLYISPCPYFDIYNTPRTLWGWKVPALRGFYSLETHYVLLNTSKGVVIWYSWPTFTEARDTHIILGDGYVIHEWPKVPQ